MVRSIQSYQPRDGELASDTVIRALADVRGVPPAEMDLCLYDVVDPEAIDALFGANADRPGQANVCVRFSVGMYRIVVDEAQRVVITESADRARGSTRRDSAATTSGRWDSSS